ncbi:ribosomal L28e/Mak16 [Tuber indicum]|nr:ribosomal L28e/Mak16 [Tuber indicum]
MSSNVSSDLIWAITRNNSSYIVKRGPVKDQIIFTREPLSLTNQHTRKHSGLVNEKAVGVQAGENGNVVLITKKNAEKHGDKPASLYNKTTFRKYKSNRKIYSAIANAVAKNVYCANRFIGRCCPC